MRPASRLLAAPVLLAALAAGAWAATTAGTVTVTTDVATGVVSLVDAAPAPDLLLVRTRPGAVTVAQTGLIADQGGCAYDASVHNASLIPRDGALVCPGARVDADLGPGDDIIDTVGTALPLHAVLGPGADKARTGSADSQVQGGDGADKIDTGAGRDTVDGGPGRDKIDTGAGDDLVAVHDGARDRVFCGKGTDTITDAPDPGDDVRSDCERTRYAWGTALPLPRVVTVGAGGALSVVIGHADQAVTFTTRVVSAPPRAAHEQPRLVAQGRTAVAAGAPATLHLTVGGLTHKPLSTRKVLRVGLEVTAVAADGARVPVRLAASQAAAAKGDPKVLEPGQLVLRIPDALRHPKKHKAVS